MGTFFDPLDEEVYFPWKFIWKVCLIKIKNKLWRYIMIQYDTGQFFLESKFFFL